VPSKGSRSNRSPGSRSDAAPSGPAEATSRGPYARTGYDRATPIFLRTREFRHDQTAGIVFVRCPNRVHLDTGDDIEAFFDESVEFWYRCVKRRVYYVVDITNLTINMRHVDTYTRNIKRILAMSAVTIVRHGGGSLQRTAGRLASMKLHVPSHIYATREEAVDIVRGLQQGEIRIATAV
jgi:hypothetical protein